MVDRFHSRGFLHLRADPAMIAWARAADGAAQLAIKNPAFAQWHVCEGTWFVGIDALPNDETGQLENGPPLAGGMIDRIRQLYGPLPALHRAQISIIFPGYPRPRSGESDAAFRYRRNRDAAHVDGLHAVGPERRRMLSEPHAWILGIGLNDSTAGAAPLVVWEGSHKIVGTALSRALNDLPPADWPATDITQAYTRARRAAFEGCNRIEIPLQQGETVLLHRHLLHGVAPWRPSPAGDPEQRITAFFRPLTATGTDDWMIKSSAT